MTAVGYLRPTSLDELWEALDRAAPAVRLAAGCTDLIPKARAGALAPETWVDLRRIPELAVFEVGPDRILLGACTTHHRVASSEQLGRAAPALVAACRAVGSRQVRVLGTLGGNLGNASPCADSVLALAALGAAAVVRSATGERRVPVEAVPVGPGETVLEWGEIIEAFEIPRPEGVRSAFLKLGPRRAHSVAKVSVAAAARLEGGRLRDLRLLLGSVGPTLLRAAEAEARLEGRRPDAALLAEIERDARRAARPIDDVRSTAAYRRRVTGVLARRAVEALVS